MKKYENVRLKCNWIRLNHLEFFGNGGEPAYKTGLLALFRHQLLLTLRHLTQQ